MEENWKSVYSADKLYKVELVKGILNQFSVESIIMNKRGSEFLVGDVDLFVDEKDFEKAQKLISEHHKSE